MWVSWTMARQVVIGFRLVTLALVGFSVSLFLLTALFLD
jgi:hypothetical protein